MTDDRKMIICGEDKYYKEGNHWYQNHSFFQDFWKVSEDSVPDRVKADWEKLMQQQVENIQSETIEDLTGVNSRESSFDSTRSNSNKNHSKKVVKKKLTLSDPRIHSVASKRAISSASSFSPVSTVETIGSGGLTPINVTDSQQLIRPLRAELRSKMGEDAKELEKRMEIRKQIMTDHEDKAIPFEPKKKQSEDSVVKRNEKRRKLVETADQMISKLERIKKARKLLVDQKEGEDEQATAKIPRIGQLSEFAAANGVTVLNLDKFICATDKRKIIYNNNGVCIFCAVHGFTNSLEKHKNDKDCPFFFCTCANCYTVEKLAEKGIFFDGNLFISK